MREKLSLFIVCALIIIAVICLGYGYVNNDQLILLVGVLLLIGSIILKYELKLSFIFWKSE